jgi:hypothetical protein
MTNEEFFNLVLPKWPAFAVKGEQVTEDQAHEILFRTNSWPSSCNDDEWEKIVNETTECPSYPDGAEGWREYGDLAEAWNEKYKILELEYLRNSRVMSAYVGGPHGWCNWDGQIGCDSYNIGKWPSVENVYEEWSRIAEAFPYLDLRCQLWSGEQCQTDEGIRPVVEFKVKDGKVVMSLPGEPISVVDRSHEEMISILEGLHNPEREHGCTVDNLRRAMEIITAV